MSAETKIEWTDSTHNFWRGCQAVSPGCAHCYAEARAKRFGEDFAVRTRIKDFDAPLRWNEKPWVCDLCGTPSAANRRDNGSCLNSNCAYHTGATGSFHRRRVFSLSLGDWLDQDAPIEWLADMLEVIRRCPNLDFLLLTKRPEKFFTRTLDVINFWSNHDSKNGGWKYEDSWHWLSNWRNSGPCGEPQEYPDNIWIGTTVENQEYADKRIPHLLKIPAKIRFLSVEPMLGPVDLKLVETICQCGEPWNGNHDNHNYSPMISGPPLPIHWVICGGESGPKARPFNIEWARSIVRQCKEAGVACFVKQMGADSFKENWPRQEREMGNFGRVERLNLKDKKGGLISEWPEDLRVREFPKI